MSHKVRDMNSQPEWVQGLGLGGLGLASEAAREMRVVHVGDARGTRGRC